MKSIAIVVAAVGPAALVGTLGRFSTNSAWVERLGWTLLHTVWQFAIFAFVAAAVHWSLRRRSARVRYVAGVVLLGAMAVAPGVTCCVVDVSHSTDLKQTRIATEHTADEKSSREDAPFRRSPMDEAAESDQPLALGASPSRHAAEPRAVAARTAVSIAPREKASASWIAALRRALAPRLPLFVSCWLVGMALFSLRPVWGLWMQWRLPRVGLSPVPASVAASLDDLARRLRLRRTVAIAQSVRVRVPMAVGYLRPLILLPGCVLTGLTAAQLEALLAHELAHIRRHDWLVNAFQLLVETVFFYHPAVWWLSRQIRQERENCCDDLAVSLVGDRGTVGRMLLALEELRERTPGLALAATGGNLLYRVRRVVAKGCQPEPAGREWLPAAVLLLLAGLGGAAWAMSAGTPEKKNAPPAATAPTTPAASSKAVGPSESEGNAKNHVGPAAKTPETRRISGRVVDEKGQPVKGARLWWEVLDDPVNQQFTVKGASDAAGKFALEAPAAWKPQQAARYPADMLWVFAPGKELTVVRATPPPAADNQDKAKNNQAPLVISLAPATETEYTVDDDETGRPVAGAVLEPWHYLSPRGYEFVLRDVRELLRRTTDSSGRVRLTSLSYNALYDVQIRAAKFGTQITRIDHRALPPRGRISLRATGRIEGRLIGNDPQWVHGIKLLFQTSPSMRVPMPPHWRTQGESLVESDEQGRFRIPEIAAGAGTILEVVLPARCPVAPRLPGFVVKAGETLHLDIPMEKLVRVKGTIRTADTHAPVAGAEIFVHYGEGRQGSDVTSDSQGHYEARVLAGPVYTQVISMPRELSAHYEQPGEPWSEHIQVTPGQKEFELPPIVLSATETRTGTLIDQRGRPIAQARVSGIRGNRRYGYAETNERGEFELQLPKKLAMDQYEVEIRERNLDGMKPTIVKEEPLTLEIDLSSAGQKPVKIMPQSSPPVAPRTEKRQQGARADQKPAVSAGPAPASDATTTRPSAIVTAATQSKPTVGRPTIMGKVHDGDGKPIVGATVRIWAAGVKHGYSTYCPSCYADCGKRAVTDAEGVFSIARVDPELRFRLLVVREGYAPVFAEKVDSFAGPAAVTLRRRSSPDDPRQVVHGHVVGPRGEPLADAVVEVLSAAYRDDHGHNLHIPGGVKGLDPLAVTNDRGDFEIAFAKPASSMTLMVTARGMAAERFARLQTGTKRHTLAINRGASVRGRLMSHGRPVGRAELGLVSRDRAADRFFSEVRVGTEPDGSFLFANVPVPGKWYVYAKMDSVHSRGATNAVACVTEQEDETVNLGDVALQPGHRVRGRVVLTDGTPVPDGMRIRLSAERAWDNQTHDLPADGRFEFDGLPTDDFSLHPAVRDYHPSPKNPNRNLGIDGFIDRDVDDFVILLDPGKERFDRMGEDFRGKPLRSAPSP